MNYPRVTEVLRPFTGFDYVPKDTLQQAANRGTAVHALCAGFAKGCWVPDAMIDEEYLGYVNSFKKWAEAQVSKFVIIEKRFADDTLEFTGQVDFVVMGKDAELYLVDIKTSAKPHKTYPVQMGAYDQLLRCNKIHVKGAMLVYLKKNGDFPDINSLEDMTEETYTFICALDCWNYFNKGRKYDRKELALLSEPHPPNTDELES